MNFNDLVYRKKIRQEEVLKAMPLILVVLVLTSREENWLKINLKENRLVINGSFYWYFPTTFDLTENVSQKRIPIPIDNKINFGSFEEIYKLLHKKQING